MSKSLIKIFSLIIFILLLWWNMGNPQSDQPMTENNTEIITYKPDLPTKKESGYCSGNSLASPLNNKAWRCVTGHFIQDPCFELDSGEIICNSFPDDNSKAFILDLEKKLPERTTNTGGWRYYSKKTPNNENDYWILELENGYKCEARTGTLPFINKQPFYYSCLGKNKPKYAGQINVNSPKFTTTIVLQEFGEQENVNLNEFQEVKIIKVWK